MSKEIERQALLPNSMSSKIPDGLDIELPGTTQAEQVENVNHDEQQFDDDDIHEAALFDNPEVAERPSLATILSILVCFHSPFDV